MAERAACVICQRRTPDHHVTFSVHGDAQRLYRQRLEAVLGLELHESVIRDRCLCVSCEERLEKIEELHKLQVSFREDFMRSDVKGAQIKREEPDVDPGDEETIITSVPPAAEEGAAVRAKTTKRALRDKTGSSASEAAPAATTFCSICNSSFASARGLSFHMRIHRRVSVPCKVCGASFQSESSMRRHVQQGHREYRLYECTVCISRFASAAKVKSHLKTQHSTTNANFRNLFDEAPNWPQGESYFMNIGEETECPTTRRTERKSESGDYKCLKCSLRFPELAELQQHMVAHRRNAKGHNTQGTNKNAPMEEKQVIMTEDDTQISKRAKSNDETEKTHQDITEKQSSADSRGEESIQKTNVMVSRKKRQHSRGQEAAHGRNENESGNESETKSDCEIRNESESKSSQHEGEEKGNLRNRLPCTQCARTFTHHVDLLDHVRDHKEGKVLLCEVCNTGFRHQHSLEDHILQHTGDYPHQCAECGKGFARAWALRNHQTVHTQETPYACKYCSVSFQNIGQRRMHYKRQHSKDDTQNKRFQCFHCNQFYNSLKALDVHLRKEHNNIIHPWKCLKCDLAFQDLVEYKNHCKAEHEEENRFPCEICDKTFQRRTNLKAHLESHSETKSAECQLCLKRFKGKSQLNSHMHWHSLKSKQTKNTSFLCEECGKSYKSLKSLRSHIRCHKGENTFTCHLCKLVAPNKSRLQKHLDTVHSEVKPYTCDICGKSFVYKVSFEAHHNMHYDKRPFLCNICGKGFRTRPHLKEHMNIHSHIKSFTCNQCGISFMWRAQLIRHKNEAHSDPNIPRAPPIKRGPRKPYVTSNETNSNPAVYDKTGCDPAESEVLPSTVSEPNTHHVIQVQSALPSATENPVSAQTSTSTLVQIKDSTPISGSMIQGQLLQNLPFQAIFQQPGTSSRTTYVIRPSHMGLVAEVLPEQQQQQVQEQQQQQHLTTTTTETEVSANSTARSVLGTVSSVGLSLVPSAATTGSSAVTLPRLTQDALPSSLLLHTTSQPQFSVSPSSLVKIHTPEQSVLGPVSTSVISAPNTLTSHSTIGFSGGQPQYSAESQASGVEFVDTLQAMGRAEVQTDVQTSVAGENISEAGLAAAQLEIHYA